MNTVNYQVGQDVSYGINGDRYYAGKIAKMTNRFITTDRGEKFTRKEDRDGRVYYTMTGCRYCYLIPGVVEYLDPHF